MAVHLVRFVNADVDYAAHFPPDDERGHTAGLELWEHVVALARFGGFAQLKRALREPLKLRAFGGS